MGESAQTFRLVAPELPAISADWAALAGRSLVPSAYGAAELVIPILKQGGGRAEAVMRGGTMAMALAVAPGTFHDSTLTSPLLASGLPRLAKSEAVPALQAFLNARSKPFLFDTVPSEGAFAEALQDSAARVFVLQSWRRAGLEIKGSFEEWLADNFDHKRRKELKRLRSRLSELGDLKLETLNQNSTLNGFVDDLLELESAGWKGKRGTALKNSPGVAAAFREAMAGLQAAGKLRFWRLALDGKPIAILYAMVDGDEAWLGKIAYDEAWAKFSPGTLLILDATESFFAEGSIRRVDSSAIPGHPMIDRVWRDRIGFQDVLVAGENVTPLGFWLVARGLLVKRHVRGLLKSAFYALTRRKRS